MLIDTHAHTYLPEFDKDRDAVIKQAIESGIEKILLPNIDRNSIQPMLDLVELYPDTCFPMMGLHPSSVKNDYENELNIVEEWLKKEKFIALGEIGIDLYWDENKKFIKEQIIAFTKQLGWAIEYNLPVVIHARNSLPEIFQVIESINNPKLRGVFHCFSGNTEDANRAINHGFKLGIGGVLTYKNSSLPEVVKEIGVSHLVLETDAPYLSPVPKRGKRNESAYIKYVAEKIAEICTIDVKDVIQKTTENAEVLFFNQK